MPTVVSWVFSSTDPARAAPVDKLKQKYSSPLAESSNFEADLGITTQNPIIRLSDGLSFATSSFMAGVRMGRAMNELSHRPENLAVRFFQ